MERERRAGATHEEGQHSREAEAVGGRRQQGPSGHWRRRQGRQDRQRGGQEPSFEEKVEAVMIRTSLGLMVICIIVVGLATCVLRAL
jgi:hypothetical protein